MGLSKSCIVNCIVKRKVLEKSILARLIGADLFNVNSLSFKSTKTNTSNRLDYIFGKLNQKNNARNIMLNGRQKMAFVWLGRGGGANKDLLTSVSGLLKQRFYKTTQILKVISNSEWSILCFFRFDAQLANFLTNFKTTIVQLHQHVRRLDLSESSTKLQQKKQHNPTNQCLKL